MGPAGWILLALVAGAAAMAARRARGRKGRRGGGSAAPVFWTHGGYDGYRDEWPDRLMAAGADDRGAADDRPAEAPAADAGSNEANRGRDEAGSGY